MNSLVINRFKCFEGIEIPLSKLTVFAGANGNGKSTAIQAILLLRHTIQKCFELVDHKGSSYVMGNYPIGMRVSLNEDFCLSLGNSSYVLNRNTGNDSQIVMGFKNDYGQLFFHYIADNRDPQLYLVVEHVSVSNNVQFNISNKEFYYLCAERVGPRINQGFQYYDFPNAGYRGEYVAQLISEKAGFLPVETERHYPNTTNPGLEFQVNQWLDFIMPGVKISAKQSGETQTSQIQIENIYTKGDPTLATNLGFGISYVLPIVATGLVATNGSLFIVENPEAHLHPSAQSKMGQFLAMIANAGVDVIVETHSDHIINGIQIAVARKMANKDDISINFFAQIESSGQPSLDAITLNEKGELRAWPKGFFDQTQVDYAHLFNLRKK